MLITNEVRPRNITSKLFIKVKPSPEHIVCGYDLNLPVGFIPDPCINVEKMEGYLPAEGQPLKKEDYPELWLAVGDAYTQTREIKEFPLNEIEKVKKFFGIKFTPRTYFVETRNCGENEFRIPDLRSMFIS